MRKSALIALATSFLLLGGHPGGAKPVGCATCSLELEWCHETAVEFYGEYRECCTGRCAGDTGPGSCNNDSNQCFCVDDGK